MISAGSEIFAKSILSKVEETIMSGKFSKDTCEHLISAAANVSGDSSTAVLVFKTITGLYENLATDELDKVLVFSLIKMTFKAPIILELSL